MGSESTRQNELRSSATAAVIKTLWSITNMLFDSNTNWEQEFFSLGLQHINKDTMKKTTSDTDTLQQLKSEQVFMSCHKKCQN